MKLKILSGNVPRIQPVLQRIKLETDKTDKLHSIEYYNLKLSHILFVVC